MTIIKFCKKCQIETERYLSSGRCIQCSKLYHAKWYANNSDKRIAQTTLWRKENPEKSREYSSNWYHRNSEKTKEYSSLYYINNREKIKKYSLDWSANNPEKVKTRSAKYYEDNVEKILLNAKEYRDNNKELFRIIYKNRKARRKSNGGKLSKDIVEKLMKLQKGKCPCCRLPLGNDFHIDHIIPLSKGGTNTDDNVQLLRAKCNLQKNAKDPIDFMQSRGFLI